MQVSMFIVAFVFAASGLFHNMNEKVGKVEVNDSEQKWIAEKLIEEIKFNVQIANAQYALAVVLFIAGSYLK